MVMHRLESAVLTTLHLKELIFCILHSNLEDILSQIYKKLIFTSTKIDYFVLSGYFQNLNSFNQILKFIFSNSTQFKNALHSRI